jgi:hypothetical protein
MLHEIEPQEPPNPFDVFDSVSQIYGFIFKKLGEEGLRELLAMFTERAYRESFEDAAAELAAVGLGKAAAIVAEHAETLPPQASACPYPVDSCNGREWLHSLKNRQRWRRRVKSPNSGVKS